MAFERVINGEAVEFGVSGKLYNNNLVMYDRKTNSYWTQIDGLAIVGELTGTELEEISIDSVAWRDWKREHPNSEVLNRDTGFRRPYGVDSYGGYYESDFLLFPVDERDDRVRPKTEIFGIEVNGAFKAYRADDLEELRSIEDMVGGAEIGITRNDSGEVDVVDLGTGEEIIALKMFWFAWYAFHPETELYTNRPSS